MADQIFIQKKPRIEILIWFLENICQMKTDKYYYISNSSYKKATLNNILNPFLEKLHEYYIPSKRYYIERKLNYKRMITIIRHVCNTNNITYTSNIEYSKSTYTICYKVFIDKTVRDNVSIENSKLLQ